ncbi:MAG: YbaN family protein [Deltaproteobacteria bacterium]
MTRIIWFIFGSLALVLGAIGVVLPVLPTTPFVILAAFCFGKGSPRVERWLMETRLFGPMIKDWRAHGAIKLKYKIMGAVLMGAVFLMSLATGVKTRVLIVQAVCMLGASAYVWTRPSGPNN